MPIHRQPPTPEQALNQMAALCAKSEYCPADIREKLLRQGLLPHDVDVVIEQLMANRFIDEERYARAFVHDKFTYDLWGRIKMRFALRAKRIADEVIDRALDEVVDETLYAEHLASLLRRKLRTVSQPLTPADRAKIYRFAAQRGYEPGVTAAALKQATGDDDVFTD